MLDFRISIFSICLVLQMIDRADFDWVAFCNGSPSFGTCFQERTQVFKFIFKKRSAFPFLSQAPYWPAPGLVDTRLS